MKVRNYEARGSKYPNYPVASSLLSQELSEVLGSQHPQFIANNTIKFRLTHYLLLFHNMFRSLYDHLQVYLYIGPIGTETCCEIVINIVLDGILLYYLHLTHNMKFKYKFNCYNNRQIKSVYKYMNLKQQVRCIDTPEDGPIGTETCCEIVTILC
jgi:hypothetical protein